MTVNKKRTFMQPQITKANKKDSTAKDYIFSNLKIVEGFTTYINGKTINTGEHLPLIPNSEHPYDHYLIKA